MTQTTCRSCSTTASGLARVHRQAAAGVSPTPFRATAPPFGAALPSGDVPLPLLDSEAAKGQTPAAGAAVPASQPPSPVLARAEGTAQGLVDRLFTAWESGWLYDSSAVTTNP